MLRALFCCYAAGKWMAADLYGKQGSDNDVCFIVFIFLSLSCNTPDKA